MRRRHASAATATDTPRDATIPPDREGTSTPPAERTKQLRVLITIQHPAHVHFYRPVIEELTADGHDVRVCTRDKDVATDLLTAFDIEHSVLAGSGDSTLGRIGVQALYELRLLATARKFRPDVVTAIGGVAAAHVATAVGAESVVLTDSEPATLTNRLAFPFADVICTPSWYDGEIDGRHVRYEGLHELSYLHPDRFTPDPDVVRDAGVDPTSEYAVVRFVSWGAQHDVGEGGLSRAGKEAIVEQLAEAGDVYITSEEPLEPPLDQYQLPVPPEDLHHLMAFARLYVGDSQTMATEAALLGTPAVRCNSFAGDDDMANFRLLADYGLVFSTAEESEARDHIERLLSGSEPESWRHRRSEFIDETIDVASFVRDVLVAVGT
jgi:predicted glycosyltransferase